MEEILYIAIGIIIGAIATKALDSRKGRNDSHGDKILLNPEQVRRKEENLNRIIEYLDSHDEASNDAVERLLGVSNNTAERYLDELEKQGKLRQIGQTGRNVVYRKR